MAKLQGIAGGLSGKMGSVIFRQRGGQTIASQYQPVVKNPSTEPQQAQRAKFKLMSQLAAIMEDGFGTMGVAERPARGSLSPRNAFVKLNFNQVTTTTSSTGVTARINLESVKLTSSFRPLPSPVASYRISDSNVSVRVSMTSIPENVASVRCVVVTSQKLAANSNAVPQLSAIREVEVNPDRGIDETFAFPIVDLSSVVVLTYGLIPSDSSSQSQLDDIFTNITDSNIARLELNRLLTTGALINTMTTGAIAVLN